MLYYRKIGIKNAKTFYTQIELGGDFMKKAIFLLIAVLLLTGCSATMAKHKKYVRDGVFVSGLSQLAFLEEWGKPDKRGIWYAEKDRTFIAIGSRLPDISGISDDLNDIYIYYRQNKIMFFSNCRLAAHYDWDEYLKGERETKALPPVRR